MKSILALALLGVALLAIAAACNGDGEETVVPTPTDTPTPTVTPPNGAPPRHVGLQDGGSNEYRFDPSELTFKVGETVTFSLESETEFHTFTVDDLDIHVSVNGGETESLTVTFDKSGTFDLICLPHETLGMVGTITVQ